MGSEESDKIWELLNGVPDPDLEIETARKYMQTIKKEFRKISKSDLVSKNIEGVILSRIIIDEECTDDKKPVYRVFTNGINCNDFAQFIKEAFDEFVDNGEYQFHYHATQLNREVPRAIENYLCKNCIDLLFWCMKTHGDGRTLGENKPVYDLIIIVFDRKGVVRDISFQNEIHPFWGAIKREWVYGNVNDIGEKAVCYNELFRRAASASEYFLYMYSDVFNNLSAMRYENVENKGTIVSLEFYRDDSFDSLRKNYNIAIEFKEPIRVEETQYKRIRKLLEISNDTYSLLINDKNEIFAIGTISPEVNRKYYKVSFEGYLHWNLFINEDKYIEYVNMVPKLPDGKIGVTEEDVEKYKKTFNTENIETFKKIVREATKQGHGTMVVFTENARDESERLKESGMCICPVDLSTEEITYAVSAIDGAIMCDESGQCFAIGMILDGKTSLAADSSRGARYNSAIRYLEQQKEKAKKTLIVVISEDGYVNCFSTNDKS